MASWTRELQRIASLTRYAIAVGLILLSGSAPAENQKRFLTPEDAVATSRILANQSFFTTETNFVMISPNRERYVFRTVRGDIAKDGVWMELWTGLTQAINSAAKVRLGARLFTSAVGCGADLTCPQMDTSPTNTIHWMDNDTIAFLWSDSHNIRQIVSVNLITHEVKYLTDSQTNVLTFDTARNSALIYNALSPNTDHGQLEELRRNGFVVASDTNGFDVLAGSVGPMSGLDRFYNEWFIKDPNGLTRAVQIDGRAQDHTHPWFRNVLLSPNGRYAITTAAVPSIPSEWNLFTSATLRTRMRINSGEGRNWLAFRHILIDMSTGTARTLWGAPTTSVAEAVWSPDSQSILLAPSCLPPEVRSDAGRDCAVIAEINVASGLYSLLPIDLRTSNPMGKGIDELAWLSEDSVEVRTTEVDGSDHEVKYFGRVGQSWTVDTKKPTVTAGARVKIEVRENFNTPPKVYAIEPENHRERLIFDPNPNLTSEFRLGRVRKVSGDLPGGAKWIGTLIYPSDYVASRLYPLVIQSVHGAPSMGAEFNLYGNFGGAGTGLGPDVVPAYLGQMLAGRNIAVLRLAVMPESGGPAEGELRRLAFEGVAKQLATVGLKIDEARTALVGWSRAGYHVEYTITHSHFPFVAAVVDDNYDPSYMTTSLNNYWTQDIAENGSEPFGDGLGKWIAHAPGFNVQNVHTPLLMVGQTPGEASYILSHWEVFNGLRHLGKPVEMYVMPNIERFPTHVVQNPRQILGIQHHVLDWLTFWILDEEGTVANENEQYARWHELRALRDADQRREAVRKQ